MFFLIQENKTRKIKGIPKLVDANFAGTKKSGKCVIILCEGDSAKAGASGSTAFGKTTSANAIYATAFGYLSQIIKR